MLQILVDPHIEDKNRDLFTHALIKECKEQGEDYLIIKNPLCFRTYYPYVITEPYNRDELHKFAVRGMLDVDQDTTANVILELIKKYEAVDCATVLVIGRGKVVGRPLIDLLISKTNLSISIANSYTEEGDLGLMAAAADIIVNATNSSVNLVDIEVKDKVIIDVGNTLEYYVLSVRP